MSFSTIGMSEDKKIKIVTHSSKYHTDDVFAVATLIILLGEDKVSIVRSRDMEVINDGDYVVDVGQIYDPTLKRFDHHQKGGAGERSNGIPYASFGLVWKEYGETISGSKEAALEIDKVIVQPIDAHDNGVQFSKSILNDLHPVDIGFLTFLFAPTWKEEGNIDEIFIKLARYAVEIIKREVVIVNDKIEAEKFVIESYNNASDKRVIELDERYPWEEVLTRFSEPVFVIYKKRIDNNWSLKTIRNDPFSFESRKKLPAEWGGKIDKELEIVTGVIGALFCHNALFLAVAKTREGILKMAEIALNS